MDIGRTLPELRTEMVGVAVKITPDSVSKIEAYYVRLLAEELEAMRPADRDLDYDVAVDSRS